MKILAKSIKENYSQEDLELLTLRGHLEYGIKAALEFRAIAPTICQQFDLDITDITPEELTQTVALAIWIHDWGKVSQDFQAFVQNKSNKALLQDKFCIKQTLLPIKKQAIRHELLSVILASRIKAIWDEWLLKSLPKPIVSIALLGVLGHHLKVRDQSYFDLSLGKPLKTFAHTAQFQEILQLGVKYFSLNSQLPKLDLTAAIREDWLEQESQKIKQWCDKIPDKCSADFQKLKKVAIVKALVMSADLAASALLEKERGDRTYIQWIQEALQQTLTVPEIQSVIDERLNGKSLLDFQKKEAEKQARVLIVIAGCGAGKTLVPFLRFKRLIEQEKLAAKMFFCYPTTATTSQGFKDYGLTLAEQALLSHSRAWVDYQLKDFSDSYEIESDDAEQDSEINPVLLFQTKVEALKLWHSKLIFCTAHTVLGLLQNHRKGLYGFPAIAQGVFVFDEIHAYPPQLFGTLLQFLRIFRHPIVLMSASLTPAQIQAIQEVLSETGESADILRGPEEIENLPRYQLVEIDSEEPAWNEVITELKNGGKVLWITNQVADSQRLYTEAKDRLKAAGLSVQPILYHARFRYQDSIQQHNKLIDAFRGNQPAFAITTQIAEMSLDISCTLLISRLAPMWALIQRLGRLNRWVDLTPEGYKLRNDKICQALIYRCEETHPYKTDELKTGEKLLELLKDKEVSQLDLSEAISTLSTNPPKLEYSTWLEETWLTRQETLMPSAYTIQVVLEDDVDKIFQACKLSQEKPSLEAQKWVVSVRITKSSKNWKQHPALKFYRIAPSKEVHYHPEIGAYEPNNQNLKIRYGHQTEKTDCN